MEPTNKPDDKPDDNWTWVPPKTPAPIEPAGRKLKEIISQTDDIRDRSNRLAHEVEEFKLRALKAMQDADERAKRIIQEHGEECERIIDRAMQATVRLRGIIFLAGLSLGFLAGMMFMGFLRS